MMRSQSGDEAPPARVLFFEYSELNPRLREDPLSLYDPQRAERPAERDAFIPAVLITSYALAREMLLDPNLSRNFNDSAPDNIVIANVRKLNAAVEGEFGPHASILTLDDPDHARVRGVVAEAFLKRAAAAQPLIAEVIEAQLQRLEGRERFDVINDYASRIPIRVLGALLGCDEDKLEDLKRWTEAGQGAFDPTNSEETERLAIEARRGILGHFKHLMEERRKAPRDDLVSDLLAARDNGAPIADHEILHNLFALLVAGHLTTADMIGNGIMMLLKHPEAREALERNPKLWPTAIEEILRYNPPISNTARFPKEGGKIGGCPYHGGDALTVALMAANFDPEKFEDPHKFDVTRRPNPHLAFGAGAHICIGAPLARIEGQMAIMRLFERFPKLRRAEEGPLDWRPIPGIRGLAKLDVLAS
ncbi:MAG TPA: cytochrome P450 [Caulobacterales bacterium]|nr:cytochrome P450 [Caulobacterales bacterium]